LNSSPPDPRPLSSPYRLDVVVVDVYFPHDDYPVLEKWEIAFDIASSGSNPLAGVFRPRGTRMRGGFLPVKEIIHRLG
jgi:hypothetical protein